MSNVFCLVPGHWANQELLRHFGEKTGYHIAHLNKGHDLTKAPNGRESLLYRDLGENFGYRNAIKHKGLFYTNDFRSKFGDWLNDKPAVFNNAVKPGINELFESNTELADQVYNAFGENLNDEQKTEAKAAYSQYLDTIFPDSKVKDIVYHGTTNKFDKFELGHTNAAGKKTNTEGFHFIAEPGKSFYKEKYGQLLSVILNIKNPVKDNRYEKALEYLSERDKRVFKSEGYDSGIKYFEDEDGEFEYVVFEPEQIHILGSKQDIQGFKQFIAKPEFKVKVDENGEPILDDYLSIMGKADAGNKDRWSYRRGPIEQSSQTLKYDQAKQSYIPILNRLSEQTGVKWQEANLNGQPAAYQDGVVLVDFDSITPDAPFHEFMHPIILLMEVENPANLDRLVREAMTDKKVVGEVNARYPNLDRGSREYRMELVATAVGNYAVEAINTVEAKGLMAAIKEFFQNFFKMMRNLMIKDYRMSIDQMSKLSLKEIGFMIGVKMPKLQPTDAQVFYNELRDKAKIVKKDYVILNNLSRMQLDYYTDTLGWNSVEVVVSPSSTGEIQGYSVRIYSPLTTRGQRFFRKKEAQPITKTNNAFFNNLILAINEKANSKENELRSALSSQARHKTRVEAKYLRGLIDEIGRFRTLDQALTVMRKEISKMNIKLSQPQSLDDISSSLKLLNSFSKITKYYDQKNTDEAIYRSIEQLQTKSDALYHKYTEKFTSQFKTEYLDKGGYESVADSINESVRDINALSLQTIGSSFAQNGIEQAIDHIIRLNAHEMNQNRREFMNELYRKLDKLGNTDLSWMVEGDGIMFKTNPEFFKKQEEIRQLIIDTSKSTYELSREARNLEREAITLQAEGKYKEAIEIELKIKSIKDKIADIRKQGYTWDGYHKFMMQYFNYEMDDAKAEHFEEDMNTLKEMYYYEDASGKLVFDTEGFQKAVDSYNPLMFQEYLNGDLKYPNQGWKYFKLVPKEDTESKLVNPKYLSLSAEQKEFYDFFVEKFAEASNNIYDQYIDDDMSHDALVRNFMSSPAEVNERLGMLESAKNWLSDLIPERQGAEELDIHGVFTGMNRKSIKFTPVQAFLKQGYAMKDQNILQAFEKFYDAGMASKYKTRVASLLESGKELAATMKRIDFDADGKMKVDIYGDPATISGKTKVSQRLEHIIEDYLTKDVYEDMFGNIKIAGKKLTGERIIDMINDFTRFRQLGLNPFSGISNLAMGAANNWTYSKRGEFFDDNDLRKAYFRLRNNTLRYVTYNKVGSTDESMKIKLLAEQMGITRQLLEKKYGNILDKAFTFQESGEFINQMASALAVMSNKRTVEALVGKGNKLVDKTGKEREVLDLFKVDGQLLTLNDEEFDLKALGINNAKILSMSDAISKINKEIHGDYDQLNKMFLKRNALGRAAATFRTWLPQAMMQRFGKERKDYQLSAFYGQDIMRKGRYVSLVDVFKEKGAKAGLIMAGNFVTGFVPFVSGKVSDELNLGELDAANLNQTLSELRLFTNIFAATLVMGKVSDDDEELEDNSTFNFIYNMTARFENELSTFYYPTASYKLFKDAIPAFDTLEQMGDVLAAAKRKILDPEADIYEKGFRKGTSKLSKEIQLLLPVTKQAQNIWSTLNVQYEKTAFNNK